MRWLQPRFSTQQISAQPNDVDIPVPNSGSHAAWPSVKADSFGWGDIDKDHSSESVANEFNEDEKTEDIITKGRALLILI